MDKLIIEFISQYINLTEEEYDIILKQSIFIALKKGDYLLAEGESAKECYFVLKGCVVSYYLVDGEVKVTEFYTEKQCVTPTSYTTKKPSEYYLKCLEDCIVSIGTQERTEELMKNVPRLAAIGTSFLEDQLLNQRLKYDDLIKLSVEERYQNLQETSPDLLNRVPQYLIASYLGIKPESLSRIRSRMYK
jgi:CRP-like cAMP-binding protein